MAQEISRRQMLQYGVGAAAALTLPSVIAACAGEDETDGAPGTTTTTLPHGRGEVDLPQPEVLSSSGGELAVTLAATKAAVDMNAAQQVRTYSYNGIVPGQTWELRPGDVLRVDLRNELPEITDQPHQSMIRPHDWTTTNLHVHGLHVSPEGDGDNVFLRVGPGESQQYEIPIPEDHPGGIFWYHPHAHGAVTQQVRGGMAGTIVIRGELDEVPEVAAAEEKVLVLQAIELDDDYQLAEPIPHPDADQAFFPRDQILYTVNGQMNPTVRMHPGEVQRWRLLNAAEGKFMSLALEDHDLHVLAWDGLTLPAPESEDLVMLSAANRCDVLVRAGQPGTYQLVLTPGSSQQPIIAGMPGTDDEPQPRQGGATATTQAHASHGAPVPSAELEPRVILTLEVTGDGPEMELPSSLPAYDPPMLPVARQRDLSYTVTRGPGVEFDSFGVDGRPFDPDREPYRVQLGTAEEWTLTNAHDARYPHHGHVFHIHVNPFLVTKINGVELDRPLWRDTFALPPNDGDSITFVSNFTDFTGKFVQHCHILSHEDLGMMEAIEVVADQTAEGEGNDGS